MIRCLGLDETETMVRESVLTRLGDIGYAADGAARVLEALAELGVLAVPLASEFGGMGEGLANAALVLEPLGQNAHVIPFIETLGMPAAVAEFYPGFAPLQEALRSAASGAGGAVLAWMEPDRGWSRLPGCVVAERNGHGWLLRGQKALVRGGDGAEAFLVSAVAEGQPALFWVAADTQGVLRTPLRSVDGRGLADVAFRDVFVPADNRVDDGNATAAIDYAVDVGTALSLAEAMGLMSRSLEMTVAYLKAREQFGVPLSQMQALQHRMVDMYADIECAWSLTHEALCSLSVGASVPSRQKAVSRAKAYVGRTGRRVAQEALQMHGAIGMTMEYPLGRYLVRLTAIDLDYGDGDWHLGRLADDLRRTVL